MANEVFFQRFNEALRLRRMSQKELAERLGVSPSNITNYKRGKYVPSSFSAIATIAKALSVSPAWLAGLTDDETVYEMTETDRLRNKIAQMTENLDEAALKKVIRFIEDFLI